MKVRTLIVENDSMTVEKLKRYIHKSTSLQVVGVVSNVLAAEHFLRQNRIDLVVIDPALEDGQGIAFARKFKTLPMVVFVSISEQFALEAFELGAIDYVLKPVEWLRFSKTVERVSGLYACRKSSEEKKGSFVVRSGYQLLNIKFADIEYIESQEDYVKIHLSNGTCIVSLMTMKAVLGKLPSTNFIRIHRSFIVPLDKVRGFTKRQVTLPSTDLPVSQTYVNFMKNWMNQHRF